MNLLLYFLVRYTFNFFFLLSSRFIGRKGLFHIEYLIRRRNVKVTLSNTVQTDKHLTIIQFRQLVPSNFRYVSVIERPLSDVLETSTVYGYTTITGQGET